MVEGRNTQALCLDEAARRGGWPGGIAASWHAQGGWHCSSPVSPGVARRQRGGWWDEVCRAPSTVVQRVAEVGRLLLVLAVLVCGWGEGGAVGNVVGKTSTCEAGLGTRNSSWFVSTRSVDAPSSLPLSGNDTATLAIAQSWWSLRSGEGGGVVQAARSRVDLCHAPTRMQARPLRRALLAPLRDKCINLGGDDETADKDRKPATRTLSGRGGGEGGGALSSSAADAANDAGPARLMEREMANTHTHTPTHTLPHTHTHTHPHGRGQSNGPCAPCVSLAYPPPPNTSSQRERRSGRRAELVASRHARGQSEGPICITGHGAVHGRGVGRAALHIALAPAQLVSTEYVWECVWECVCVAVRQLGSLSMPALSIQQPIDTGSIDTAASRYRLYRYSTCTAWPVGSGAAAQHGTSHVLSPANGRKRRGMWDGGANRPRHRPRPYPVPVAASASRRGAMLKRLQSHWWCRRLSLSPEDLRSARPAT